MRSAKTLPGLEAELRTLTRLRHRLGFALLDIVVGGLDLDGLDIDLLLVYAMVA